MSAWEIAATVLASICAWSLFGWWLWKAYIVLPLELPPVAEGVLIFLCGPYLWGVLLAMGADMEDEIIDAMKREADRDESAEEPNQYNLVGDTGETYDDKS